MSEKPKLTYKNSKGIEKCLCNLTKKEYSCLIEHSDDRIEVCEDKNKIIIKDIFETDKKVDDECRYSMILNKDRYYCVGTELQLRPRIESTLADFDTYNELPENICLIIIESPHTSEYNDGNFAPLGPAKGPTGNNIKRYIADLFNQCLLKEINKLDYHIVICNPVQVQASMSVIHRKPLKYLRSLKNKVWESLYYRFGWKADFIQRVKSYHPLLVINASTVSAKGIITDDLMLINKGNNSFQLWECNKHPSIWFKIPSLCKVSSTN